MNKISIISRVYNAIANRHKLEIPGNIHHKFIVVDERDKVETLRKLLNILKPKRALAFINSTHDIDVASEKHMQTPHCDICSGE